VHDLNHTIPYPGLWPWHWAVGGAGPWRLALVGLARLPPAAPPWAWRPVLGALYHTIPWAVAVALGSGRCWALEACPGGPGPAPASGSALGLAAGVGCTVTVAQYSNSLLDVMHTV
jgi:hypothetical protein